MQLYIVRHGQSTHNANQDVPHNPDPPLTALGREQAELTAKALLEYQLNAAALYASPQRRALETAFPLYKALGLSPHILPDLCEVGGLSENSGLCRAEILKEWPGVTLDESITETGWWTGGTSDEEETVFFRRAGQAAALLRARHAEGADTIIAVTHGRFGSALLCTMLGVAPQGYSRFPFDNCAISRIDYDPYAQVAYAPPPRLSENEAAPEAIRLRFHNQNTHLPISLRT